MQSLEFKNALFDRLLDLGFCIYGGSVRDKIWKYVHDSDRKQEHGLSVFNEKLHDLSFSPETVHNRLGNFNDIDCIGTYDQFKQFIKLFPNIEFLKPEEIEGLPIKRKELEIFNVSVLPDRVSIDMIVCTPEYIPYVNKFLWYNLDFACNGICVQKINNIISFSLLHNNSLETQISIINDIKNDIAHLMDDKTSYQRIGKMISYGWYVNLAELSFPHFNIQKPNVTCIMYMFARQSDSIPCKLCNIDNSTKNLFILIDGLYYHAKCYVNQSIKYHNRMYNDDFDISSLNIDDENDDFVEVNNIDFDEVNNDYNFIKKLKLCSLQNQEHILQKLIVFIDHYQSSNYKLNRL